MNPLEMHPVDFAYELNELGFDGMKVNPIDTAVFLAEYVARTHMGEETETVNLAEDILTEGFDNLPNTNPINAAMAFVEFIIVKDSFL